ncbi:hypothetical protein ACOJ91_001694 [Escherichia coli]|nr:hypothetical protein [Escherichia coli]
MSLINTETRSSRRGADPLVDLRNKPFCDWTDEDIKQFGLVDCLLEFVCTDTSSPLGLGMTLDYTDCWELGVRDDCLVMTRVKPVHPEYARHFNMKAVLTSKTRDNMDLWVGYSKVLAWRSLAHKDSYSPAKRGQYFQMMWTLEKRMNDELPIGGLPYIDNTRAAPIFQQEDYCDDRHANDRKIVDDNYVPGVPEQR